MQKIILLVGVPCSGKTYVGQALRDSYTYVPHDEYPRELYATVVARHALGNEPVIAEAPFDAATLVQSIEALGPNVEQWLVTDKLQTITKRYYERTKNILPKNFATNHGRYEADTTGRFIFSGTSSQIVALLKALRKQNESRT